MNRKQSQHDAIRGRARKALRDLYHNATPSYPCLDDEDAERFQSWFEIAAQDEIDYLRDGGAYGNNYRKTLAAPCNGGRYPGEKARAYYVARGLRERDAEREDCGVFTGWDVIELAAGNKSTARMVRKVYKSKEPTRNNARWERISEYGKLYQWGRGGRTLAPDDLITQHGGSSFSIRDVVDDKSIAYLVELIQIVESFNAYVSAWCDSVPEQWAEIERERKAEERAERKRERDRKRAVSAWRERCESYAG